MSENKDTKEIEVKEAVELIVDNSTGEVTEKAVEENQVEVVTNMEEVVKAISEDAVEETTVESKEEENIVLSKPENTTEMDAMTAVRQELLDTKYQHMKKKFTEMGIPEVFKAGKKKGELIDMAISKLQDVKALEQAETTVEEIKEETEKIVTEKKFSREDIEKNIKRCQSNLRNGIPAQRPILVTKMKQLEKMLEEYED